MLSYVLIAPGVGPTLSWSPDLSSESEILSDAMHDRTVMSDTRSTLYRWLPSARKLWLNVHLWLGLTAGLALALIGLTGSLLVFSVPMLKTELGSSYYAGD